jgi:hypothetical protein
MKKELTIIPRPQASTIKQTELMVLVETAWKTCLVRPLRTLLLGLRTSNIAAKGN